MIVCTFAYGSSSYSGWFHNARGFVQRRTTHRRAREAQVNEWYSMSRLRLLRASSASSLSPSSIDYYSDPSPGLSILNYCSHSSQQERSATIFPATWCDCASSRADHDLRSLIVRSRTTRLACDPTCPTFAVPATLLLLATLRVVCPEYLTRPQS